MRDFNSTSRHRADDNRVPLVFASEGSEPSSVGTINATPGVAVLQRCVELNHITRSLAGGPGQFLFESFQVVLPGGARIASTIAGRGLSHQYHRSCSQTTVGINRSLPGCALRVAFVCEASLRHCVLPNIHVFHRHTIGPFLRYSIRQFPSHHGRSELWRQTD